MFRCWRCGFKTVNARGPAPTSKSRACLTEWSVYMTGLVDRVDCHARLKDLARNSPEQAAPDRALLNPRRHSLHQKNWHQKQSGTKKLKTKKEVVSHPLLNRI